MSDTDWQAPGPGEWVRLADHFDRPWTAEYARVFAPAFRDGAAHYLHDYGMPVRMIDVKTVHGYPYLHAVPLVGPDTSRVPPAALLWLLARAVPAMRRCERNAARTLRARPWRARVARWWSVDRPRALAENRALATIDPDALGDASLARHLEECERTAMDGYRLHFELHGTDMFPIGLLLDACRGWGIDVTTALDLVVDRVAEERGARLDAEDLGHCIVAGYDIDRPRLCEMPRHVAGAAMAKSEAPSLGVRLDRVDDVVPSAHREEFDILFGDARTVFPVRDDNGMVVGAWRMGLLRRAYLAAGERLAAAGTIEVAHHVFEATVPEVVALVQRSTDVLPAETLAARAAERAHWAESDPPLRLGRSADIPLDALPPSMRAVTGAQLVLRDLIERSIAPDLEGFGVGDDAAEGTARVVSDVDDAIARMEPGDILVVRATSPAFNAVLPLAAALVTEHGGAISHAAIAARELGIPAVIGVRDATRMLRDGARVRVDPGAGRVAVVDPSTASVRRT